MICNIPFTLNKCINYMSMIDNCRTGVIHPIKTRDLCTLLNSWVFVVCNLRSVQLPQSS